MVPFTDQRKLGTEQRRAGNEEIFFFFFGPVDFDISVNT